MKIEKSELRKALEIVKPGLANKEIIEQTSSFAFIGERVVTYNDEISLSHPVPGLQIKGAIKADELYKFLGKVKSEEILMEKKEEQIILKNGRAKVGFMIAQDISLPLDEEIAEKGDWKRLPKDFVKALAFTADTCSKDLSNPKLVCVHVNKTGVVESTDSYRVAHYKLKKRVPIQTVLIPAFSVKEIIKMKPTEIAQGNGWTHFKNKKDTVLSCRIFVETFVNTKPLLNPKGNSVTLTLPDSLTDVLEKARIFAERKSVIDENINITLKPKELIVESKSETGWFEESIPLKGYKGEEILFSITPYLLKDILNETKKCTIYKDRLKFSSENWVYITALRKSSME